MGKQDMKIINFLFIISLLITCAYQINIQENLKTKTESKIEENLEAHTEEQLESETEGHSLVKIDESLVSQSSPYSKNRFPATNAFHNKFTHTNKGKGMWWKVKFPVKYNFSKIRIKNRANCCPDRLDLTKVYVSGKLCGTIPKGTKKNTWYEVTCNLTGNEIKLVTTQNTYLSIQGFKAYAGTAAIAIPTPVVDPIPQHLVKIDESLVSQSSPYSKNRFPATNAFHNKFNHTNKGKGMWWKVKFPVKYNFSKIRIKNRANCCPERLDLTKVYVSGKLCGTIPKGTKKKHMV